MATLCAIMLISKLCKLHRQIQMNSNLVIVTPMLALEAGKQLSALPKACLTF